MPTKKPSTGGEDHVYLLNRVTLDDYLSFMASYPVDAGSFERRKLAAEWRACRDAMDRLRETEPDWADDPPIEPLPPKLEPLAERVRQDPIFAKAFGDVPVEFGIVELDRLVVSQKLVCVDHFARLRKQLGRRPSMETLFRFCLPVDRPTPPCRGGRVDDDTFAFVSESSDLRFLDAVMLRPEQVSGYQAVGPVAGVVGLVVGFGSNMINAVAAGNRLVLSNGHHRTCALRALGVTHVPMAIQRATRGEELEMLAPRAVRRDPPFYLADPRPPVLKDYFDARLSRHVRLAMTTKQVRVSYSIEEMDMP